METIFERRHEEALRQVLHRYLVADNEPEADRLLACLFYDERRGTGTALVRQIERIAWARLRHHPSRADLAEEVCLDVVHSLIQWLRQRRAQGIRELPGVNLFALATTATQHACGNHLRRDVKRAAVEVSLDAGSEGVGAVTDSFKDASEGPVERVVQRGEESAVWAAVRTLDPIQCAAMLLGPLADSVRRWPALGVAPISEMNAALPPDIDLFELFGDLPLDDAAIAQWLGVDRQRVINARFQARAILAEAPTVVRLPSVLTALWNGMQGLPCQDAGAYLLHHNRHRSYSFAHCLTEELVADREAVRQRAGMESSAWELLWPALPVSMPATARGMNIEEEKAREAYKRAKSELRDAVQRRRA